MNYSFNAMAVLLVGTIVLASCHRPTAYVQPGTRESFATNVSVAQSPAILITSGQSIMPGVVQSNIALNRIDAFVSSDPKLAENKSVQKRLTKLRTVLAEASTKVASVKPEVARKQTLMQRLVINKVNKKISKQLNPSHPEKALASKDILVAGAILVLGGLLLALLTSGVGAVIGIVALAVGLVMLLVGIL